MKSTQNTTKKPDFKMTISSPILTGSGIEEAKCAELHQLRHCVAVLQGKMTAYELIEAIESISGLAESLTTHLADVCGICGGCDACNETLEGEQEIKLPPELLDELDIPRGAKLEAYADPDEGLILVGRANYEHDISDVPGDLLQTLVTAGVCVSKLEEHLMETMSSMVNNTGLYPYSLEEARRQKEIKLWRESRKANADCRAAIEDAVSRDFDGKSLNPGCVQSVLAEFGYKRVNWVLATTLQVDGADGRFSPENMAWARWTPVRDLGWEKKPETICVDVRPELLEQFVNQYREAVQALGLFDSTSCKPDTGKLDFTGKVLVLSPDILKEECWRPEDQLWYAHDGFGCRQNAIGRSVRCTCLGDGEETRWNRHDFIGVLRDECLPDWAREKLAELTAQAAPEIGGMTMN